MTITITPELNDARLGAVIGFLDTGTGNSAIQIYGGTRPDTPADAPVASALVSIQLTKPAGSVSNGTLLLTASSPGLIMVSGVATWARVVNGAGEVAFDCDAGQGVGAHAVQLVQSSLLAGGDAKLTSAILG
jgi:hypothetical protein